MYDFVAGKAAWLALGLPSEGSAGDGQRAIAAVRDVVQVSPGETVKDARCRLDGAPVAAVTSEHGIVVGLIRPEALGGDDQASVASVMQPGPSTFRPSVTAEELSAYLEEHDRTDALITTLEGRLVGLVTLDRLRSIAP